MDSAGRTHVLAFVEALILKEAFAPLTKETPLGDYAADAFAEAVAGRLGDARGR